MMRRRTGSILLEASLAIMLLVVALVAVAQLLAVAGRQRQETRQRAVATREVANVMEYVMALPWDETTRELKTPTEIHSSSQELLPAAALAVEVTDTTEPREAKRIRVSLTYRNTAGMAIEPITLVAWKFSPGGIP